MLSGIDQDQTDTVDSGNGWRIAKMFSAGFVLQFILGFSLFGGIGVYHPADGARVIHRKGSLYFLAPDILWLLARASLVLVLLAAAALIIQCLVYLIRRVTGSEHAQGDRMVITGAAAIAMLFGLLCVPVMCVLSLTILRPWLDQVFLLKPR